MIDHNGNIDLFKKVFKCLPYVACLVDFHKLTIMETNSQFDFKMPRAKFELNFGYVLCDSLVQDTQINEFRKALSTASFSLAFPTQIVYGALYYSILLIVKLNSFIFPDDRDLTVIWTITRIDPNTLLLTTTIQDVEPDSSKSSPKLTHKQDAEIPFSPKELVDLFQKAPIGIHCTSGSTFISVL